MNKLKTLKEIGQFIIEEKDLKEEAIKWIMEFDKQEDGHYETLKRFTDGCFSDWIKHFFNILKEDLDRNKINEEKIVPIEREIR